MNKQALALGLLVLQFLAGLYLYPGMPESMASHWDASGAVNGHSPKLLGLFFLPFISTAFLLFFIIIPLIDPLKKNIEAFRKYYDLFVLVLILFFSYLYALTLAWNMGVGFDMNQALIPGFALLIYSIGAVMENSKMNWFVGIRTPWTMSSETVWKKTHKLGGLLFKASGIIIMLGLVLPAYAIWFIIVPLLLSSFYAVVYSYIEYQKGTGSKKRK